MTFEFMTPCVQISDDKLMLNCLVQRVYFLPCVRVVGDGCFSKMLLFHPMLWVIISLWNFADVIISGSPSQARVQKNSHSQAGEGLPTARRIHQPYSPDMQYLNRDTWPFESENQFESPDSGLFTSDVGPHDYIPPSHNRQNPSRDSDHVIHSHYSSVRQQPQVLVRPETKPPYEKSFADIDIIKNNGPTQKPEIYKSAPNRKETIGSSVSTIPKEKHPRHFQLDKFQDPPKNKYSSTLNYNDDGDVSDDNDSDYYTNGPSDREEYSPQDSQIHEKKFIGQLSTEVPSQRSTFMPDHIQRPTNTPEIFSSPNPYVNNDLPSQRPHVENREWLSDVSPTWAQLPQQSRPASSPSPLASPVPTHRPSHSLGSKLGTGQCPTQATGAFPYPPDCRRFVNCWRGRGFVQACVPGTVFNAETRECDHPHKVHCEGEASLSDYPPEADLPQAASLAKEEREHPRASRRLPGFHRSPAAHGLPTPPTPTPAQPLAEPRHPSPRCPGRSFSGLAPHPTDCRKFLNCWNGTPFVQECGPGTVFNPRILVCDFPYRVKCNQSGSHDNSSKRTNRGQPQEEQTSSRNVPVSTIGNHHPMIVTSTILPTIRTNYIHRFTTPRTFRATEPTTLIPTTHRERISLSNFPTSSPYERTTRPSASWSRATTVSTSTFSSTSSPTTQRPRASTFAPTSAPTPASTPPPAPTPSEPTGQVLRLRGGPTSWEGFVEVAGANGGWGLICDGSGQWNLSEAAVVCRQLGFHRGAEAAWQGGAPADAQVAWDAVQCSGLEATLGRCWVTPSRGRCDPTTQAAVVRCVRNHASLCRPGELNHAGRCFAALPPAALSALEAHARCAARGARLVEILSQEESDAVSEWLVVMHPQVQRVLTAGIRRSSGDAWHWNNSGELFAFHKWWPGWLDAPLVDVDPADGAEGELCVVASRRFRCPGAEAAAAAAATPDGRSPLCDADYFFWHAERCDRVRAAPLCQRPHDDVGCVSGHGHAYGGAANVTASGEACLPWDAAAVAGALKYRVSERSRRANLSGHNHCRRLRGRVEQPWCFVGADTRVEPCDIPRCPPAFAAVEKTAADRTCGAKEFECRPGTCIPNSWLCDGNNDCPDGRDEQGCSGLLAEFARREGRRLAGEGASREQWLGVEAATCALRCLEAKHFVCRSFSFMEKERKCVLSDTNAGLSGGLRADAAWDYLERRALASACGAAAFRCPDGRCLDARRVCDGRDDCGDRADERLCPGLDFQLRLAAGRAPHEGRLEVKAFGRWGTVCDDLFGAEDADVACRQLGFTLGAADILPGSHFGPSNLTFIMDDLKCQGNESSLSDCNFSGWGVNDCTPEEEAGLVCRVPGLECAPKEWRCAGSEGECIPVGFLCDDVPDCKDGSDEGARCQEPVSLRLAGGPHARAGRLEVRRHGVWGTVCDDDFGAASAAVACRALGLAAGGARARKGGVFGPGRGPIWLDQVICRGNESALEQCLHEPWGKHNCAHDEDVAIECDGGDPSPETSSSPQPRVGGGGGAGPMGERAPKNGSEGPGGGAGAGDRATGGGGGGGGGVLPPRCGERWPADVPVDFRQPRVIASLEVPRRSYPWQASVRARAGLKSVHWCGAVVLGPLHVITAAHCLLDYVKSAYIVRVGDHDTEAHDGTEQEAEVEEIYMHEGFNRGARLNNDLALVKLKGRGVELGAAVQPACLPAHGALFPDGLNCSVSGWGSARADSDGRARRLRAAWVPLLPQDTCRAEAVYGPAALTDAMFCAGRLEGGPDACQGDSGGPLVCRGEDGRFTLVGVTSWGLGCGRPNKPGVYTRIAYFRDWLDRKLEDSMSGR